MSKSLGDVMNKIIYFSLLLMINVNLPNLVAQNAVINLLHINDSHSNLLPGGGRDEVLKARTGGLARAASVIGYAKMQDPETMLLHAGDIFVGDLTWYLYYGFPELAVLKQLGLDAVTVGNHEFDAMSENFLGLLMQANVELGEINYLSSNLIPGEGEIGPSLKSYIKDTYVKEVKGVKVGIFGMTSAIANVTSMPNPDILVSDEYLQIAQLQVDKLKDEGCNVIIFLSHLGINADKYVAMNVSGINVIVGSHDHIVTEVPVEVVDQYDNITYIVQAGAFYHYIGSMQINVENGKFSGVVSEIIKLDENIPEEPTTLAMLESLINEQPDETKMLFLTQVAYCNGFMTENVPNPLVEGNKTTDVGSFVADAFKEWGGTEIGFTTSGLTSQPMYEGPIVGNDVYRILGYGVNEFDGVGYNMVKFNILGKDLFSCIMFALGTVYNDGDDEFLPQVSGMKINYYTGDYTQCNITVNDEPLDFERSYSFTSSVFIYFFLTQMLEIELNEVKLFPEMSDFKVLLDYAINKQVINPTSDTDARIVAPVNDSEIIPKLARISAYPNPVSEVITLEFSIEKPDIYSIDVFNLCELNRVHLENQFFDTGNANYQFNVEGLSTGDYFVRIKGSNGIIVGKFAVVR